MVARYGLMYDADVAYVVVLTIYGWIRCGMLMCR
jgi:hypothetical protein